MVKMTDFQGLLLRELLLNKYNHEIKNIADFLKIELGDLNEWMRSLPDSGEVPNHLYHRLQTVNHLLDVLEVEQENLSIRVANLERLIILCRGEE